MKVWKVRLTGILVCQVVLALVLWGVQMQGESARSQAAQITDFDTAAVDKIEIRQGKETLSLLKKDGTWSLPGYHELKADTGRVEQLLKQLEQLSAPGPETQTNTSHERFEVTEDKAQAIVKLYQGEKVLTHLLLGKVPSLGKRFLRLAGRDEVYRSNWDGFGVTALSKDWLDKDLLASGTLQEVAFPNFKLLQTDGEWSSEEEEKTLDQKKVADLVKLLEKLTVIEVAELDAKPGFDISTKGAGGEAHRYAFFESEQRHYVKRDDIDLVFQVPEKALSGLKTASLEALQAEEKVQASPTPEAPKMGLPKS